MPIVFIHGVSVRKTDDYLAGVAQRKEMFASLVVNDARVKQKFSTLSQPDEVFWGDLGVKLRWGLKSMFGPGGARAMGPEQELGFDAEPPFAELLDLFAQVTDPDNVETLDQLALKAAKANPADFMRALMASERDRFSPQAQAALGGQRPTMTPQDAASEGRMSARLLMAAEEVVNSGQALDISDKAQTLDELIDGLLSAVRTRVEPGAVGGVRSMGVKEWFGQRLSKVGQAMKTGAKWAANYVGGLGKSAVQGARNVVINTPGPRTAAALRSNIAPQATLFFGDVFEYLRRGIDGVKGAEPITVRVRDQVRSAAKERSDADPLIVVTHSFGGMIFYDLITSSDPKIHLHDLPVDLWVSVGSQVGLFAEMAMFRTSPVDRPTGTDDYLSRPGNVRKWVNFWDAADIFSYQAEPVFGSGVSDITMPGRTAIAKAHSAYFGEPFFYREIAKAL